MNDQIDIEEEKRPPHPCSKEIHEFNKLSLRVLFREQGILLDSVNRTWTRVHCTRKCDGYENWTGPVGYTEVDKPDVILHNNDVILHNNGTAGFTCELITDTHTVVFQEFIDRYK